MAARTEPTPELKTGNYGRVFVASILLTLVALLVIWLMRVDVSPPARGLLTIITAWFVQCLVALSLIVCVCKATFNISQTRQATVSWFKLLTDDMEKTWNSIQKHERYVLSEQTPNAKAADKLAARKPEQLARWRKAVGQSRIGWELTDLAANHSRVVSRPVELAALLVLIFGLARTQYFDGWASSTAMLLLLLLVLTVCIVFSFYLRRDLQRQRSHVRAIVDKLKTSAELSTADGKESFAGQLAALSHAIASIKHGAFQPTASNPILRAAIYALGSFATVASQWFSSSILQ